MRTLISLLLACAWCEAANVVMVQPVAAAASAPTPDLLWWKLNEGTSTDITGDGSLGGDDGTTDASWVTGKSGSGYALDFSGSQDSYTDSSIAFSTNQVTVCVWVNADAFGSTRVILEPTVTSAPYFNLTFEADKLQAAENISGTFYAVKTDDSLSADTWYHVAVTFDGQARSNASLFTIYVNGDAADVTTVVDQVSSAPSYRTEVLSIGSRGGGSSAFFDGSIDDLRIYKGILTETQIEAVMADPQ